MVSLPRAPRPNCGGAPKPTRLYLVWTLPCVWTLQCLDFAVSSASVCLRLPGVFDFAMSSLESEEKSSSPCRELSKEDSCSLKSCEGLGLSVSPNGEDSDSSVYLSCEGSTSEGMYSEDDEKEKVFKKVKKYEEEIVAMLQGDLQKLSQKLYEHKVVSSGFLERFATLDHENLHRQLQVRYLLHDIYESLRSYDVYDSFLNTIWEFDRQMYHTLCNLIGEPETVSDNVNRSSLCEYFFSDNDFSLLTECLIECSDKWEEIAISIGLSKFLIEECRSGRTNSLKLANVIRKWFDGVRGSLKCPSLSALKDVLESKLVGVPKVARNLKDKFMAKHKEDARHFMRDTPNSGLKDIYWSNDTKVMQCKSALLAVRVVRNMPILYQWEKDGKVLSNDQIYSGVHDPILFINTVGGTRQGKYKCNIKVLGDDIPEKYAKTFDTFVEVRLTVEYYPETEYFFQYYRRMNELPHDSWPPKTSAEFINLVLILGSEQPITKKYAYSLRGSVDDIISGKKTVAYKSVFQTCESESVVLVEGCPGSGKTTLMYKIAREWATKKDILWNAKLVVLIPLRYLGRNSSTSTLSDILGMYIEDTCEVERVLQSIMKSRGENVCIIIDGLDEYEDRNKHDTVIYKLIHKKILPLAMIIVASRPVGVAKVRQEASISKRLEVLGFTDMQICEYVRSYYTENTCLAESLLSYLEKHINILHLCYLPVHAAMICHLYNCKGNIPHTETEIYKFFTLFTLQRTLNRCKQDCMLNEESLNNLPKKIDEQFKVICKLAHSMTIQTKQAISQVNVNLTHSFATSSQDDSSLGLVIIDNTAGLFGFTSTYTFLHQTLQEYLAAVYLTKLTEEEKLTFFQENEMKMELLTVMKFFFGMTKFDNRLLPLLKSIMADTNLSTLNKVHFAFESQQKVVCSCLLEATNSLSFEDHNFSSVDFIAMSYLMSATDCSVTKLIFDGCILNIDGVSLLVSKLSSEKLNAIRYFGYHDKSLSLSQCKSIRLLLRELPFLETLDLERTPLGSNELRKLTKRTILPHLKTLKINLPLEENIDFELLKFGSSDLMHVNCTCSESEEYMQQCLKSCDLISVFGFAVSWDPSNSLVFYCNHRFRFQSNLNCFSRMSKLVLTNCGITDNDIQLLIEPMKYWKELHALHLDFNEITGKGAELLSRRLGSCIKFEVFSAHCNQIDGCGALAIANTLAHSGIQIFDVRYNPISNEEMNAVVQALVNFAMNIRLYFTRSMPLKDFISGSKILSSELESVYFDFMEDNDEEFFAQYIAAKAELGFQQSLTIVDGGATEALANALKCSRFVPKVDIFNGSRIAEKISSDRKIFNNDTLSFAWKFTTKTSVMILSEALQNCINIRALYLNRIDICLDGAKSLAESLKFCIQLQVLDLSNNCIDCNGAIAISVGLKCCIELEEVYFADTKIGSSGAVALTEALKHCPKMKYLYLGSDYIDSEGTILLAGNLKDLKHLTGLYLSENKIECKGAKALVDVLQNCQNLKVFNLCSNNIGTDGAIALAQAFSSCGNLESIDLSGNNIGSSGAIALANALKNCTNLRELHLQYNNIGLEGALRFNNNEYNVHI